MGIVSRRQEDSRSYSDRMAILVRRGGECDFSKAERCVTGWNTG